MHPTTRRLSFVARLVVPALLALPLGNALAGGRASSSATVPAIPAIVCNTAIQHPLQVRVEALDPVRHGAQVRLRLTMSSRVGLANARARVVSTGSARSVGRSSAGLGRLSAGRERSTEFTVVLPERGNQFLVQFRIEGEGEAGPIGRGAVYNLLPDGPEQPARVVAVADGRTIAEHPARRMP